MTWVFFRTLKWGFASDGIWSDSLLGSSKWINLMQNLVSDLCSLKWAAVKKVQDIPPQTQLPCFPCRNSKETDSKGRHTCTQSVQLLPQCLATAGRDFSRAVQILGSSVTAGCKAPTMRLPTASPAHTSSQQHTTPIFAAPEKAEIIMKGEGYVSCQLSPRIQSSISSERGELWYCPLVISIDTDTTGPHDSWLAQMSGLITLPFFPPLSWCYCTVWAPTYFLAAGASLTILEEVA